MDLDAPFVIPNAVRNLAGKREEILRFALNDKRPNAEGHPPSPPLQRGECGSEAHEALTFWLLLGQAKSNGKSTLNDKRPNAEEHPPPFKGGECGSEALGKKGAPLGGGLKA